MLVNPDHVLRILLEGYVRFVIQNDEGVPIKWGRLRRLFKGAARDAVLSLSPRCTTPGCRVRSRRCEANHLHEYCEGGSTDPDNGGPGCDRHNRCNTNASGESNATDTATSTPTAPMAPKSADL